MSATKRSLHLLLAAAGGTMLLGAGVLALRRDRARVAPAPVALAAFTEREVRVEIALEPADSRSGAGPAAAWLRARFTPTRPGFRLYAKELPRDGLEGIGRPTLLEIASAPRLRAIGALQADRVPGEIRSDVLGLSFPVYPPGPVTLTLPVSLAPGAPTTAELSVTYMPCSDRTCLPPTIDRRVTVTLPPR